MSYSPSFRLPQPSLRPPQPSFRPPTHHSGASRNLCLPPPCHSGSPAVIPAPPTVIPANFSSFRRKPESMLAASMSFRLPQPSFRRIFRHSGASRNLCLPDPCHSASPNRHSGEFFVIPAQAGIYACRLHVIPAPHPSFRRKPESMLAGLITVVRNHDAGFRRKPE